MKLKTTLVLFFVCNILLAQIPLKQDIQEAYSIGYNIIESLQSTDDVRVGHYFKDKSNFDFLIDEIKSEKIEELELRLVHDVMFNQESGNFEFVAFAGKSIPAATIWGLYEYRFIVLLEINIKESSLENQIITARIITTAETEKIKKWWLSYMKSYKDPIYSRNEIADKYGLIPPPPPPPEAEDWLRN